jgi:deoxycytidylate deaminase
MKNGSCYRGWGPNLLSPRPVFGGGLCALAVFSCVGEGVLFHLSVVVWTPFWFWPSYVMKFLNLFTELNAAAEGVVMVAGSGSLFLQGLTTVEPNDLDLSMRKEDIVHVEAKLIELGFRRTFDFPDNTGFDLRLQYVLDDVKVDMFIVGSTLEPVAWVGIPCVPAEVVWAARGYYAAKGNAKANNQLLSHGFVGSIGVTKPTGDSGYPEKKFGPNSNISDSMFRELQKVATKSVENMKVAAIYVQGNRKSSAVNLSAAYGDHAESRALDAFVMKYGKAPVGGIMYCTLSGCSNCKKQMAAYGIETRYLMEYTGKL